MPQFSYPGGARPMPWDRNPSDKSQNYQNGPLAPHATTTRWTYTVPAGRKAIVSSLACRVKRVTVAAPVGFANAFIDLNAVLISACQIETNVINDADAETRATQVFLQAGDVIRGRTGDASTGGTLDYAVTATITEFDA